MSLSETLKIWEFYIENPVDSYFNPLPASPPNVSGRILLSARIIKARPKPISQAGLVGILLRLLLHLWYTLPAVQSRSLH
jgi:hypothetical protein